MLKFLFFSFLLVAVKCQTTDPVTTPTITTTTTTTKTTTTTDTWPGNPNWCKPVVTSTGIPHPTLPVEFQTLIESNFRNSTANFTTEFEEYYDFVNNRGTIIKFSLFGEIRQYFLYETDEMITIYDKVCNVTPLDKTAIGTPFGYEDFNGVGHIFSPSNALDLEFNQEFLGENVLRGISVLQWQSCAYFEELSSTVKILWSFSNNNTWNSTVTIGSQSVSVPVEMKLEGLTKNGEMWEQNYEYIRFRPFLGIDNEIFETPVGVFCPGRIPTKKLPTIPTHFSYRIEGTSVDLKKTVNQAEWYDDDNQLTRFDYQPLVEADIQMFGNTSISEIHDFKRGIRFIIDKKSEKCLNVTTLDESFDAAYVNNTKLVKLRTALELFNFDKNASAQYQYHGTKQIRQIGCDVWIAIRDNFPPIENVTSTWEWYFMTADWTYYNYGITEYSIPVKLIITNYNIIPSGYYISDTIVFEFFDFVQEKPDIFAYDLELCYNDLHTKNLMFKIDQPYTKLTSNKRAMQYAVLNAISKSVYLLPTRIANIQFEETSNETIVFFKLLDNIPIAGDVVNPVVEISLSDAYTLLKKQISGGNLIVTVNGNSTKVLSDSLKEVNQSYNSNYKSGTNWYVIVGSAIGGLVLGVIIVSLITMYSRKKSTGEPVLRMSGLMNPNFNE